MRGVGDVFGGHAWPAFHEDDDPVGAVDEVHGAEDGGVDVSAADQAEGEGGVEEGGAGQDGDGLLARVDEVGVDLVLGRVGPVPRMPFSEWRITWTPGGRWPGMRVGSPMPRLT